MLKKLESFILNKKAVTLSYPFGEQAMVFKLKGKMFALIAKKEKPLHLSLKCDPFDALSYREIYESVIPGYHLNKKHWNTIYVNGEVKEDILFEMINDSYELVLQKFSKKIQNEIENNKDNNVL